MKFDAWPVNLEAERGPEAALRLSVRVAELPTGGTNYRVWAARLPETLSLDTLAVLATGALTLPAIAGRTQASGWNGLRTLRDASTSAVLGEPSLEIEGQLFDDQYDMALAWDAASSAEQVFDPFKERSDQCWFLAVTAQDAQGQPVIARSGLGQWAGQEHLAGIWLSPSNFATLVQAADWLVGMVRSFKPLLDWRIAQTRPPGSDWCLSSVRLTDDEKTDDLFSICITPRRAPENIAGISAPDRRMQVPVFNIRLLSHADEAEARSRTLTTVADSLRALLNTRALREITLTDGNIAALSFVSDMSFGTVQDSFAAAVDLTWSTQLVKVGIF